ncbi:MAG: diguanylate cyclase [Candidatus Dadabacteria bacterium]|nr:diguanylate cyclase [Candidatus Dadabacteria bacterium]NIT14161.1 diguanylate cyclase [Candidatus Dadabacteria bacterium]
MTSFLLPGGILFLSLLGVLKLGHLDKMPVNIVEIYSIIVLASSFLIGLSFKRSRLIYSIIIFALAGFVLYKNVVNINLNLFLLSIYLPFNFFIIYNMHERGVFQLSFWKYSILLIIQILVYLYISGHEKVFAENVFDVRTIDKPFFSDLYLSKISFALYSSVLIYFLADFIIKKDFTDSGFFWSFLSTVFLFQADTGTWNQIFCLGSAGLILLVSFVLRSYDVAYKDKLTELPSRRSFDEAVSGLGNRYAIGLVDIDFFKKFNDKYGHDVGDQVLKMVASRLSRVGGGGKAFRYGGEEFVIIFPNKDREHCYDHLENLRKDIEKQQFSVRGKNRPRKKPKIPVFFRRSKNEKITVSIGVAERTEKHTDVDKVIKAADNALYKAKKDGRNRVCYI